MERARELGIPVCYNLEELFVWRGLREIKRVKRYCSGVCQNDSPRITMEYREHDSWQSARKRAIELAAKPSRLKREKTAYARLPMEWSADYLWVRYFYG